MKRSMMGKCWVIVLLGVSWNKVSWNYFFSFNSLSSQINPSHNFLGVFDVGIITLDCKKMICWFMPIIFANGCNYILAKKILLWEPQILTWYQLDGRMISNSFPDPEHVQYLFYKCIYFLKWLLLMEHLSSQFNLLQNHKHNGLV